jgi:PAS domain S-box-containing protein
MSIDIDKLSSIDLNLLNLLTENLPDMLWIKDKDGVYIYANKAICEGLLMAKDIKEPVGKTDVFFALREREAHKEDPNWHTFGELCFNSDQVVIDANKPMKFEEWGNVKGKLLYLEVNKAPFYDENGNIIGTVGSGRDITELKLTQIKLAKQAQILEQIHDSVITTDLNNKVKSFNRSAIELFEYSLDEIIDINMNNIFVDLSDQVSNYDLENINDNCYEFISKFKKRNGSEIICEVSLSMLKDENGNNERIIYYIKDITEKDKLTNEVKIQENIITNQAHHVAMGEMIGNIAHQWRQPLSIISTLATGILVRKESNILDDEILTESCENIDKNAQYLSKTIDDFRNFIKGDRVIKRFKLKEELESFLNLLNSSIKSHQINISVDVPEDIEIDGYENELTQCFINLYNNSKDAFKEHSIQEKYIFINSFVDNDYLVIVFKDNANGIPDDIIDRIFEPYFTTKHQSQGTGLGLNMTYNFITEGMEGILDVSNVSYDFNGSSYKGAQFTIKLPITI